MTTEDPYSPAAYEFRDQRRREAAIASGGFAPPNLSMPLLLLPHEVEEVGRTPRGKPIYRHPAHPEWGRLVAQRTIAEDLTNKPHIRRVGDDGGVLFEVLEFTDATTVQPSAPPPAPE